MEIALEFFPILLATGAWFIFVRALGIRAQNRVSAKAIPELPSTYRLADNVHEVTLLELITEAEKIALKEFGDTEKPKVQIDGKYRYDAYRSINELNGMSPSEFLDYLDSKGRERRARIKY